jgi:hypothetical protein
MSRTETPLIISLLFCLDTEQGHLYAYNRSVGEAAQLLGWEHFGAVRAAANVAELPDNWSLCLGSKTTFFRSKTLARVEKMLRLIYSLLALLRSERCQSRPVVFLFEWFHPMHVIAFCLALIFSPRGRNWYVWIIHRFEFPKSNVTRLYRLLHAVIRGRLGRERLILFSENDPIAKSLVKTFGQAVYVLPMPQIASQRERSIMPEPDSRVRDKVICWWPGLPSALKGLAIIVRLVHMTGPEAQRLCIVADEGAGLSPVEGGCQVVLLPVGISRAEYIGWMHTMDVALLPYSAPVYATRTSGPFADAIAVGKPAVVTAGTWMADELRKYGLDELILDWNSPSILSDLLHVARAEDMRAKLARMQAAYADYHSVRGFARAIHDVFDETQL